MSLFFDLGCELVGVEKVEVAIIIIAITIVLVVLVMIGLLGVGLLGVMMPVGGVRYRKLLVTVACIGGSRWYLALMVIVGIVCRRCRCAECISATVHR